MISRPELAGNALHAVITIDGRPMRHLGEGRFAPCGLPTPAADDPLIKRFEVGGRLQAG